MQCSIMYRNATYYDSMLFVDTFDNIYIYIYVRYELYKCTFYADIYVLLHVLNLRRTVCSVWNAMPVMKCSTMHCNIVWGNIMQCCDIYWSVSIALDG